MADPTTNTDIRLDERKRFLQFGPSDYVLLKEIGVILSTHEREIIDRLYDHLLSNPDTRRLLKDDELIHRLKGIQQQYFFELLNGNYDQRYAEQRLQIGMSHKRVALDPQWYLGAYLWYLNELVKRLVHHSTHQFVFKLFSSKLVSRFLNRLLALNKAIFFDMGLAIDAYIQTLCDTMNERHQIMNNAITDTNNNLTEMSGNLERISSIVIQNAQNASDAATLATRTLVDAEKGGVSVQETVNAVSEINDWVKEIETISRKTNLLAINATIESARAGEHGKGFNVVAKEVRALSEQTQDAVQRISLLAEKCLSVAQEAGQQFSSMAPNMRKTQELVSKISEGTRDQSSGVVELSTILDKLVNLTRTNKDELNSNTDK